MVRGLLGTQSRAHPNTCQLTAVQQCPGDVPGWSPFRNPTEAFLVPALVQKRAGAGDTCDVAGWGTWVGALLSSARPANRICRVGT